MEQLIFSVHVPIGECAHGFENLQILGISVGENGAELRIASTMQRNGDVGSLKIGSTKFSIVATDERPRLA